MFYAVAGFSRRLLLFFFRPTKTISPNTAIGRDIKTVLRHLRRQPIELVGRIVYRATVYLTLCDVCIFYDNINFSVSVCRARVRYVHIIR